MTETVFDRVKAIVADLFLVPAEQIGSESSPETIVMWDSMQHLNLALAVEQTFGIQLSPEDIASMKNVGMIVEVITGKLS
jgi:acyl carrier protein